MMSETYAKVIEDSVSHAGDRLTTFEVRFHRFVLAEFNTHRVFSRNSASSRAIPLAKQLRRVEESPALPVSWPAEQRGMQGGEELDESTIEAARRTWLTAGSQASLTAKALGDLGVHKSVANRLLEPFMWHTVVVTATAWSNFFGLRCNPMAQPEIRVAAEEMRRVYEDSVPRLLGPSQWHLPYVDFDTAEEAQHDPRVLVKVSAARCARVSYLTQDGRRNIADDVDLYDRLTEAWPMHVSPLEHPATPAPSNKHEVLILDRFSYGRKTLVLPRYGNLLGWHSHRFDVETARDYQAYA